MTESATRTENVAVRVVDMNALLTERQKHTDTISGVFKNVFHYAAFCEANFNNNMKARGANLTDTTFTSDLAIAEYCEQLHLDGKKTTEAVEDTIQRACRDWKHDPDYIIALIFAVNAKAWEHHAMAQEKYASMRAFTAEIHLEYSRYYSERYYSLVDYVFDELYPGEENAGIRSKIYDAID